SKQTGHKASTRGINVSMIISHLRETGGGATFMSGTAIVNNFAEAHNMLKITNMDGLVDVNALDFDAWAANYTLNMPEQEVTIGGGIKTVDRVRAFSNVEVLAKLLSSSVDIVPTSAVDGIKLPKLVNENNEVTGEPITVEILATELQREMFRVIH